ncbi:hypothetical protein STEG23_009444, partial [Scotinomys teguina]
VETTGSSHLSLDVTRKEAIFSRSTLKVFSKIEMVQIGKAHQLQMRVPYCQGQESL